MSKTVFDFHVTQTNGDEVSLQEYAGKTMLIVNTASKCGFTPQFEGLQKLSETYQSQNFVVLGFPCDQFKNQEFDQIEETMQFCQTNYGVTFPMFAKINVNGVNEHPLYTFLKDQKDGLLTKDIKWNFTKFLVNRDGEVVQRFSPTVKPEKIAAHIEKIISK